MYGAYLTVIVAAFAGFVFGAVWYVALCKLRKTAAGIKAGPKSKSEGRTLPLPDIQAGGAMLVMADSMHGNRAGSAVKVAGKRKKGSGTPTRTLSHPTCSLRPPHVFRNLFWPSWPMDNVYGISRTQTMIE
jgi:hypothetical protein